MHSQDKILTSLFTDVADDLALLSHNSLETSQLKDSAIRFVNGPEGLAVSSWSGRQHGKAVQELYSREKS